MDLNKLTLGDKVVVAAGVLLFIDLLFLPWHRVKIEIAVFEQTVTRQAVESPNAFWGVLALLLTVVVVAAVLIRRLSSVKLPDLPIAWNQAVFYATIVTLALLVLKLLLETDFLGFGAFLGIVLAAAMVYGGFLVSKDPEAATGTVSGI